eukprot:2332564-Rhodomonas_salina.1
MWEGGRAEVEALVRERCPGGARRRVGRRDSGVREGGERARAIAAVVLSRHCGATPHTSRQQMPHLSHPLFCPVCLRPLFFSGSLCPLPSPALPLPSPSRFTLSASSLPFPPA